MIPIQETINRNDPKNLAIAVKAIDDFHFFVRYIFSASFEEFVDGDYLRIVCAFLSNNRNTMRVSARDHFKSTSLYAFVMWRIWQMLEKEKSVEEHYFSFNQEMAGYHIRKIKSLISVNPWFGDLIDIKEQAESVLKVTWTGKSFYSLEPKGLLAFKRGIHCDGVYVDDPFQDPENKLQPTLIKKINNIFKTQILSMPHKDHGICHVVGTPQTNYDFFFEPGMRKESGGSFSVKIMPAIISYEHKETIWPEYWPFDKLMQKKADLNDDRVFNQEFMCSPVFSEDSYLKEPELRNCIDGTLHNVDCFTKLPEEFLIGYNVVAGWDIGKRVHPSHFSVFLQDEQGNLKQIATKWFLHWDYTNGHEYIPERPTQLEYVKEAIKNLRIDYLYYDATRGEFETLRENGALPSEMIPIIFTVKKMSAMASDLQQLIATRKIKLIDDERQIQQMLMVNNDLKALENPDGHGDSFWSNAMVAQFKENVRTFSQKPVGW